MSTDNVALLSAYKRAKKSKWTQGVSIPEFVALWFEKNSDIELDTTSYNSAARGHFMEPYAVEEYNRLTNKNMLHWDDMLIHDGLIGFSPDAMPVGIYKGVIDTDVGREQMISPNRPSYQASVFKGVEEIVEIKCYEPKHHIKTILTKPMDRIERFQIATAMYVMPWLKSVDLFLYCPSTMKPMHLTKYKRDELKEELAIIDEICEMWVDNAHQLRLLFNNSHKSIYTMKDIENDYIATQDSNGTFCLK